MSNAMIGTLWLLGAIVTDVLSTFYMAKANGAENKVALATGAVLYLLSFVTCVLALKYIQAGILYVLWSGIGAVAKYFNQVYTKSSKKFTLEHSMLCELLFGKIDLGNKELEKAITLLNIDKIYIAYNEYRIDREIDKRYDEDDY